MERLWRDELRPGGRRALQVLNLGQYLERYLWPLFPAGSSACPAAHTLSIAAMVNEKFREGVPPWDFLAAEEGAAGAAAAERFGAFFRAMLGLREAAGAGFAAGWDPREHLTWLEFLANAFQSLENAVVRPHVLRLVSLPLLHALSPGALELELHRSAQLQKFWARLLKREAKAAKRGGAEHVPVQRRSECTFFPALVGDFFAALASPEGCPVASQFCERSLELVADLLSQLPTRKFVRTYLLDQAFFQRLNLCTEGGLPKHQNLMRLAEIAQQYMDVGVDGQTGAPLGDEELQARNYDALQQAQRLAFRCWPELHGFAHASCGALAQPGALLKHFEALSDEDLLEFCSQQLRLASPDVAAAGGRSLTEAVLASAFRAPASRRQRISALPLYPTESMMWDSRRVPELQRKGPGPRGPGGGEGPVALPKLNLQFLTQEDYLVRNFNLFQLEATYEIREDVHDALRRLGPRRLESGAVGFQGWAKMALPVSGVVVTDVRRPHLGEERPSRVIAEVNYDLSSLSGRQSVLEEWDQIRQHDVLFLLSLSPGDEPNSSNAAPTATEGDSLGVLRKYGLKHVRGCEVVCLKDEKGEKLNDFSAGPKQGPAAPEGTRRKLVVELDPAQYNIDMQRLEQHPGGKDVYSTFNVLLRRDGKENNFKSVLSSIRELLTSNAPLPDWLNDTVLGYGDPAAAQPQALRPATAGPLAVDFKDTFVDAEHVVSCFPGRDVRFKGGQPGAAPFRVSFEAAEAPASPGDKRKSREPAETGGGGGALDSTGVVQVESYKRPNPGPYPQNQPRLNSVPFTPVQVEAILSAVQPGLTLVVGPPGTGKTDVAVQSMHLLFNNDAGQRTLFVTKSNQALNDVFLKLMERDVPARYLLRLGMGEAELGTDVDFSKAGRVDAMLQRRLDLLGEVERLARIFEVATEAAQTCETAKHFWLLHVLSRWERFVSQCKADRTPALVGQLFPFSEYFSDAPGQPLMKGIDWEDDMAVARGCFRHLKNIFKELEECYPFELLRSMSDRGNYLLTKQARIVAMTCTHASIKRDEFLRVGLEYDTLVMEESAQVLEIESFIPMLLQKNRGQQRLKRVVLIGDHNQLPPVVQNLALQKYAHMDQSLFSRLVRLGVPHVELNAQGRARPSIAKLYNWRYRNLGDLPHVQSRPRFIQANPGFAHECQFVDVPDFGGVGESEPSPHFLQNLGEAEYLISVYQYMRIIGYPADRISILTTYNGQKNLLRDVANLRCADHPLFGLPAKIETVDRYQGQQNDYILLSLVRTRNVGHLRDVRRLVVATSRARLGLYIFGRWSLFSDCYELQNTFKVLESVPRALICAPTETFHASGDAGEGPPARPAGERPAHPVVFTYETLTGWLRQRHQAWEHQQTQRQQEARFQQQRAEAAAGAAAATAGNEVAAAGTGGAGGRASVQEAGAVTAENGDASGGGGD